MFKKILKRIFSFIFSFFFSLNPIFMLGFTEAGGEQIQRVTKTEIYPDLYLNQVDTSGVTVKSYHNATNGEKSNFEVKIKKATNQEITIENLGELRALAALTNSGNGAVKNKTFKLDFPNKEIDLEGTMPKISKTKVKKDPSGNDMYNLEIVGEIENAWIPIGKDGSSGTSNSFQSNFDGNDHTIKNMSVFIDSQTNGYSGFFGDVEGKFKIKNFKIKDSCSIVVSPNQTATFETSAKTQEAISLGKPAQSKYYFHAGTAIGRISVESSEKISNLHAENCNVIAFGDLNNFKEVNGKNGEKDVDHKYYYAGGIIGTLEHPSNKINIESYTSNNVNVYARGQAGGIAGTFSGGNNDCEHDVGGNGEKRRCTGVIMKHCRSAGEIATSGGQAGGLVAGFGIFNENKILGKDGFMPGKSTQNLIGSGVYVEDCSHIGNITGGGELVQCGAKITIIYGTLGTQIAGLIAAFGGQGDTPITFNDCYSKGKISGSPSGEKAGFLCGFGTNGGAPVTLKKCISESEIVGWSASGIITGFGVNGFSPVTIEECCFKGNINKSNVCGGLIGKYGIDGSSPLTIKNCSVQGNISGSFLGGMIGGFAIGKEGNKTVVNSSIIIENCHIKCDIEGTGGISGGLIGGYGVVSEYSPLTIKNCSTQGKFTSSDSGLISGLIVGFGIGGVKITKIAV
ncbi:MAG: DUF916 domain-containing protein [Oscillospiraceae bacterium]|jgi:hypothetical protein|nr:DUF916 domain-containing protein [Oscillospiraceae bacterium]